MEVLATPLVSRPAGVAPARSVFVRGVMGGWHVPPVMRVGEGNSLDSVPGSPAPLRVGVGAGAGAGRVVAVRTCIGGAVGQSESHL